MLSPQSSLDREQAAASCSLAVLAQPYVPIQIPYQILKEREYLATQWSLLMIFQNIVIYFLLLVVVIWYAPRKDDPHHKIKSTHRYTFCITDLCTPALDTNFMYPCN